MAHPEPPLPTALLAALLLSATLAEVSPVRAHPGDVVVLTVRDAAAAPEGVLRGRPLHFYAAGPGLWQALAPLPTETAPGAAPLALSVDGVPLPAALEILPAAFRSTRLSVAPRFLEPPASERKRIRADQAAIDAAYEQPFSPPRSTAPFAWPRVGEITSHYGDQRVYNGKTSGVHYGLDLEAARGAPIAAAQDGVVVLVRDCYYSGGTVILWHGAGVFTSYLHQSRPLVKVGEVVHRGQRIGLVGSTGRSTGPHLHWGVKVDGLWVDPQSMLRVDLSTATALPAEPPLESPADSPAEAPAAPSAAPPAAPR